MPWVSLTVHVYVARGQPATRVVLDVFDDKQPMVIEHEPDELLQCSSCYRRIPAKDLIAHAYYDGINYYCRETEYGRRPSFPFEYARICKGTAWQPSSKSSGFEG